MRQAFTAWWHARNPRERLSLGLMTGTLILALIAQLLWSAHEESRRLRRQIDSLRIQLAVVNAQAAEIARLRNTPAPTPTTEGEPLLAATQAAASVLGDRLELRLAGVRQIEVKGVVAFDAWVEWLAAMHETWRLRVVRASVTPQPNASGFVRVEAELVAHEAR